MNMMRLGRKRLGLGNAGVAGWVALLVLMLGGCGQSVAEQPAATPTDSSPISPTAEIVADAPIELPTVAATEVVVVAAEPTEAVAPETDAAAGTLTELLVIYTNDEHGWMSGIDEGRGAAEMVSRWRELGCEPDNCLIVSGGDMWTGPAISTWFEGESMAEVMNAMGYAAAAVGNHEFDFGLEQLETVAGLSEFPFVSANIRNKSDGLTPDGVGIEPFTIVERGGVQIGIVGLSTQNTPLTTLPTNVETFDFMDYAAALEEVVPQARAAGAQLIVVPGHVCSAEIQRALAANVRIDVIGGGHCNELSASVTDYNTAVLIGGSHFSTFATATLTLSDDGNEVTDVQVATYFNEGAAPDADIAEIVAKWQVEADLALDETVAYLDEPLERRGEAMQDLITYSWLEAMPVADIAVTNLGGMRAAFDAGDMTLGDLITVMPFNNVIVEVEMTGAQFTRVFGLRPDIAVAGAERGGASWRLTATGEALGANDTYIVLVNDFMYAGGDEFGGIAAADPDGYNTAVSWRQPVIDWIRSVESSDTNPLNASIDLLSDG